MKSTRRIFMAGSLAATGTSLLQPTAAGPVEPVPQDPVPQDPALQDPVPRDPVPQEKDGAKKIECLDYGRSFICNTKTYNSVRFWIESRTILFDREAEAPLTIYQCGSCKSENTFAKKDLLAQDNYDFMPIYGGEDLLILRRHVDAREKTYRQLAKVKDVWGEPNMRLNYGRKVTELTSFEQIQAATASDVPLAAQTEITNEETGLRCLIEYPVKTMNISVDKSIWQVDTGPIAFPDLTRRFQPPVDSVRLAYAVFNSPHFCDFVVEQPTSILQDGTEVAKVYHYSHPVSFPATNRVLSVSN